MGQDRNVNRVQQLYEQFADPPRAYSPVPIWWWSGERLEPQRLRWQLEQCVAAGIYNLVLLNLAPTGPLYGCDADDPPFFSEEWWQIFLGVCADARELGVQLWIYDQIGFSGANLQGELVRDHPEYAGQWLETITIEGDGPLELVCPPEGMPLAAACIPLNSDEPRPLLLHGHVVSDATPGARRLRLIYAIRRGFDYCSQAACAALIDLVHGAYQRQASAFFGDVIVGSFQDELPSMPTWSADFLAAFQADRGYDLLPQLIWLWEGEHPWAQRVRADYHAMRAQLAEAAFFRPLFDWHEQHGLICGFDQQGPARGGEPQATVRLYADYLKTHRWYGAPGSDHHGEAKIHSSLAHLYQRPRVWIESFHSSGWGGTLEETFDWLLPWLRAGATLYNPHAIYYSTRGGWWEWAPPSTCWRQPYWRHYRQFADAISRICFLLSQGRHVCDLALLFPTTTIQACTTPHGPLPAAAAAHTCTMQLVGRMVWFDQQVGLLDRLGHDYDILDDDSLQRAHIDQGSLQIGDEAYRTLILPACHALLPASAAMLAAFVEAGGLLIAIGCLPEVACGDDVAALAALQAHFAAGRAVLIETPDQLPAVLARMPRRVDAPVPTLQRRIDDLDVLFVPAAFPRATQERYNGNWLDVDYTFDPAKYASELLVQVHGVRGVPVLWEPFSGQCLRLAYHQQGEAQQVQVPFRHSPAALIVWQPEVSDLLPSAAAATELVAAMTIDDWQASLEPTIDNRYGDLDRPAAAGAPPVQTWRFDWSPSGHADPAAWGTAEATQGIYGWWQRLALDQQDAPVLAALLPTPDPLGVAGWQPAIYSLSRGIAHDTLHMSTLGPKGHVPQEFLAFGAMQPGERIRFRTSVPIAEPIELSLALGAAAAKRAWINGQPLGESGQGYHWLVPVALRAGLNLIEWELTTEEALILRASWALVRDPQRYARPEWMRPADPIRMRGSLVRFRQSITLDWLPKQATIHVGAGVPCRLLINGHEIGRQGGFDPYDGSPRVQRYQTTRWQHGVNLIEIEAADQGNGVLVVFDALINGPDGVQATLFSSADWQVQRDTGVLQPTALNRRQWVPQMYVSTAAIDIDPAFTHVWRRPHPLPAAAWLEDAPDDETVLPIVPDAFAAQPRQERLRWLIPPGAQRMTIPLCGQAQLWIDGVLSAELHGPANIDLPPGAPHREAVLLIQPAAGCSAGSLLAGPITYTIGHGPFALHPWEAQGLAAYAGGVRYQATLLVPQPDPSMVLDLGAVRGTAEVLINGQLAGVRVLSPYHYTVGPLLHAGENRIEVLVYNTLAPYLHAVSPTHYIFPGQLRSGMFGPVQLWRAAVSATATTTQATERRQQ